MPAAMWLANMNNAGSEVGAGPVGPGAGRELMLLSIGRIVVLGFVQALGTMLHLPIAIPS